MEVTYLICNHNYGEWVEEAIQSALDQTIPCNICIIDDCSTDYSEEIINKIFNNNWVEHNSSENYCSSEMTLNNKKIVFIRTLRNVGPAEARNYGIEETIGYTDIYAILDADDVAATNKTETLLPYFEDENIGIVYADYSILNTKTNIVSNEYKRMYDVMELVKECIIHSGSFIRAAYLQKVKDENGYYDRMLRVCEDYDLWLRLCRICMAIHHPEPLTKVRVTPKNSTNSVAQEIWQSNMNRVRQKCQI